MRRVASGATDVGSRVRRTQKISLLVLGRVALKTASRGLISAQILKTNDLRNIASAIDVGFTRTVASLTPLVRRSVFLVQDRGEVCCLLEMFSEILMAGFAHIRADIVGR